MSHRSTNKMTLGSGMTVQCHQTAKKGIVKPNSSDDFLTVFLLMPGHSGLDSRSCITLLLKSLVYNYRNRSLCRHYWTQHGIRIAPEFCQRLFTTPTPHTFESPTAMADEIVEVPVCHSTSMSGPAAALRWRRPRSAPHRGPGE
jgi:hypothetical protein